MEKNPNIDSSIEAQVNEIVEQVLKELEKENIPPEKRSGIAFLRLSRKLIDKGKYDTLMTPCTNRLKELGIINQDMEARNNQNAEELDMRDLNTKEKGGENSKPRYSPEFLSGARKNEWFHKKRLGEEE